jgi:signal transduction histidine kinase
MSWSTAMVRSAMPWRAFFAASILLLLGISAAFYEEDLYQAQRASGLREQAEILAASVPAALAFDDHRAAVEYVDPMRVNAAIQAVGVYGLDGKLVAGFARSGAPAIPQTVRPADSAAPGPSAIVVPVTQQHGVLGAVYVRASPEPLASRLTRYAVLVLLAVMAALVVAGLGSANRNLQRQAASLADANASLQKEMIERAKAEEALRQSQKMEAVGQLSGGIAHDFNNHLMIIKGNLHLLKRKLALPDDNRHIAAAMEGIDRAAALTQRVLGFSRKQALSPVVLDLNELLQSMEPLIRSSLGGNVTETRRLAATHRVRIDRNQMENVILNLVINARDAMQQGGMLMIATEDTVCAAGNDRPPAPAVMLTVEDTGAGMPPDVLAKALDPFFTTKPIGKGTGLGLSSAYGFIAQSGGALSIESEVGRGTAIKIVLPAVSAPVEQGA